ncbi:AraC family transcriptional regulator [Pseudomonas sp. ABC1]|uniref:AraC family transcriptional regulator n=1 Tax=Pseudomonas sp. ABC1 TaxID=2748080 RepID=UPI0015C2F936|nr:AraC family transcriptional regulator [Pseudomonas sp. ABC1]QLF92427.1 AraC family transcriptional regulator [Pseudomonas sp. ABC1]
MSGSRIRLGDLSVGFALSLGQALEEKGLDAQALLEAYGLDAQRLAEPQARLSIPRFMRLGHAAIQASQDPALGLAMGRLRQASHLGLAGVTAALAPNVREAARTLIRFEPLYASNYRGNSSFHEDPGGAWLRFYSISPYNAYNTFVVDSVLAGWLTQLRTLCGVHLSPREVEIEYPRPAYAEAHEQLFDCPLRFCARANQLYLDKASLALRNPLHCPGTWQELLQLCEEKRTLCLRTHSLSERVTALLGPLLKGQEPELAQIAQRLRMPEWTLRRRLAAEGTNYSGLLNSARQELATAYIRDTEASFGEIAWLLGFSSAEAFQRAFKRWTGQTPGAFRRGA